MSVAVDPRTAAFTARFWPEPAVRTAAAVVGAAPGTAPAYVQAAYANEMQALADAPEGVRNETLNRAAFNLAQLVASGHLPREQTENDLYAVAVHIGLTERETRATLRSAFASGQQHPRVVPSPIDVPDVTVIGDATAFQQPPDVVADQMRTDVDLLLEQFPALDWVALWGDETGEEWIVEPVLPARRLVALFSPPKVGKSLLMLELAVAVARGEPVLGTTPPRSYRVLYVDFENDPRGDVRARLQAMGRKPEELSDLLYLSFPRLPYLDTPHGGITLLALVDAYRAEVVIIDTISRAVGGEENENDTWLRFYRNTGVALKARGVTCIRLDHTGKDPTKGMRGGSAKYGDVDAVWSMVEAGADRLHLECTANRLPIAEKHLHLIRKVEPHLHHAIDMRTPGQVHHDVIELLAQTLDRMAWPKKPNDRKKRLDGEGEAPARQALIDAGWEPEGDDGATLWRVRAALVRREEEGWLSIMPEQGALKQILETVGLETSLETEDPI